MQNNKHITRALIGRKECLCGVYFGLWLTTDQTRDREVQPDSRISTTDIPKENKKLAFIQFALWFVQRTAKWKGSEKFC